MFDSTIGDQGLRHTSCSQYECGFLPRFMHNPKFGLFVAIVLASIAKGCLTQPSATRVYGIQAALSTNAAFCHDLCITRNLDCLLRSCWPPWLQHLVNPR